jgi:hypothetical protein
MDDSFFVRRLKRFRNLLGDTQRVIDHDWAARDAFRQGKLLGRRLGVLPNGRIVKLHQHTDRDEPAWYCLDCRYLVISNDDEREGGFTAI